MSNLADAKRSIQAELNHAREGLAYYQSRVDRLQETMASLDAISGPGIANGKAAVRKQGNAAASDKKRDRKSTNELPSTRGEYWLGFISDKEPKTAAEIFRKAVSTLGFDPSKSQQLKYRASLMYALNHHVNITKKVQDSGAGRERRYTKR